MRKILLLILALVVISCGPNSTQLDSEVETGPYTITNISSGIYHIQDYNSDNPAGETFDEDGNKTHFNNCSDIYLLVGDKEALMIDLSNRITWADNAAESLQKIVSDRIEDKPLTITFTHNHGDHTGMLSAFIDNPDVVFSLPRTDFEALVDGYTNIQIDMFDDGKVFDLGSIKVDAVKVPGHTAGSMVFFVEGRNILISGDAIGSGHGVWIFDLDSFKNYVKGFDIITSAIPLASDDGSRTLA